MYTIFALKQAAIDDFITKLEAFFKQKIMKHVLDDPEDQDIIAMLQARHVSMLYLCYDFLLSHRILLHVQTKRGTSLT